MVVYDELGPEKILEVYDARTGLHGFTVIDNTALGPAKGGIRMTPSVSIDEVAKLARTMTWKCALAGLPFGGGKSGIIADPKKFTTEQKMLLMKSFGQALRPIAPKYYIAAPDVNTAEFEMKAFVEGNGSWKSATGKPSEVCEKPGIHCGIPHEYGSTGFGVFHSTLVAAKHAGLGTQGFSVAIEGFGNVGTFAAKHFSEHGVKVVAVSDSKGTIFNEQGLDFAKLLEVKTKTGSVINYQPGQQLSNAALFELEVDVLIPSALPDVITIRNVDKIKAKLVVEAANIPTTPEMEKRLHERGVLVVPDFVANAGGVISSYAEYRGKDVKDMFPMVEKKVVANTRKVLSRTRRGKTIPRDAAMALAMERVKKAMAKRNTKDGLGSATPQADAASSEPGN